MADLTGNQAIRFWGDNKHVQEIPLDSSAAQTVYAGEPLFIDQSEDTINARQYVAADTLATGDVSEGIALEKKVVALGDVEADSVIKYASYGSIVGFLMSVYGTFTRADNGTAVYMSDSGTITTTSTSNLEIGVIHNVEDGFVYVRLTVPNQAA